MAAALTENSIEKRSTQEEEMTIKDKSSSRDLQSNPDIPK